MRNDIVQGGRIHASLVDEDDSGNPWKFKSRYFNLYPEEEGEGRSRVVVVVVVIIVIVMVVKLAWNEFSPVSLLPLLLYPPPPSTPSPPPPPPPIPLTSREL